MNMHAFTVRTTCVVTAAGAENSQRFDVIFFTETGHVNIWVKLKLPVFQQHYKAFRGIAMKRNWANNNCIVVLLELFVLTLLQFHTLIPKWNFVDLLELFTIFCPCTQPRERRNSCRPLKFAQCCPPQFLDLAMPLKASVWCERWSSVILMGIHWAVIKQQKTTIKYCTNTNTYQS